MFIHRVAIIILVFIFPLSAQASIDDQLEDVLGAMTNVTAPGGASSQSRGVLSGGSVRVRWRTSNPALINFTAPSAKAGCNGVNLFGGSLSFINADEFKTMLRNIGAAAGGYAFKLALQALCPTCESTLSNLQDQINKLNKHFRNSCAVATTLVDKYDPFGLKTKAEAAVKAANAESSGDDWFTKNIEELDTAIGDYLTANPTPDGDNQVKKNVTNTVLQEIDVKSWYNFGGGNFEQVILSITGAYILDVVDGSDGEKLPVQKRRKGVIGIEEFLYGGDNIPALKCNDSDCMDVVDDTITIIGMYERVETLIGNGSDGILNAYLTNTELSEEERKFMNSIPLPVAAMLRNLARNGNVSGMIVKQSTKYIAMELTKELLDDILQNVYMAASQHGKHGDTIVMDMAKERQKDLSDEYNKVASELRNTKELLDIYGMLIKTMKPGRRGMTSNDSMSQAGR